MKEAMAAFEVEREEHGKQTESALAGGKKKEKKSSKRSKEEVAVEEEKIGEVSKTGEPAKKKKKRVKDV